MCQGKLIGYVDRCVRKSIGRVCYRSMASRHNRDNNARARRKHRATTKHDQPEKHDNSVDVVDEGDGSG